MSSLAILQILLFTSVFESYILFGKAFVKSSIAITVDWKKWMRVSRLDEVSST